MKVTVLGGGIVGVTCALALRLCGAEVEVMAEEVLLDPQAPRAPSLASAFPAASVLAHSLAVPASVAQCWRQAEALFELFADGRHGPAAVRRQWHYELFAAPVAAPALPYQEFCPVEGWSRREGDLFESAFCASPDGAPCGLFGWRFRVLFVEYPPYVERLRAMARSLAIGWHRRPVRRSDLAALGCDAVVNCLGFGACELLADDPLANDGLLGDLLLDGGHDLRACAGPLGVFSYSSHLAAGCHRHANLDGSPTDLYCYPRRDTVVLGGTRLRLRNQPPAYWEARASVPTETIQGRRMPATLLSAHETLLARLHGIDLERGALTARRGVRPVRLQPDGSVAEPRVEAVAVGDRPLIHCYGFGGAGVTLSWWAAARVLTALRAQLGADSLCAETVAEVLKELSAALAHRLAVAPVAP